MKREITAIDRHIGAITKKYLIDFFNALLFPHSVLWDGDDQFNELPILKESNEASFRFEHRGALFVDKKTTKALRLSVMVTQSVAQRVCYRLCSLQEPLRINEEKRLYYPLDGPVIDLSIADLNLGNRDPSSYTFSDNTATDGIPSNKRIFATLRYLLRAALIVIEDEELFTDLLDHQLSTPPIPSDPHFIPVFGARNVESDCWD